MPEYLRVVFDIPGMGELSYLPPEKDPSPELPAFGRRVLAPLGSREATGYVVGLADEAGGLPPERVKRARRFVDQEALFGQESLDLAAWMSGMYFCGLGEALASMLPSGRREQSRVPGFLEDGAAAEKALVLSSGQSRALGRILASKGGMHYLYGMTGSGKTEVFLQAAEATLAEGRGVIYLVPEIALTHQVLEAVSARFGDRCALLHSGLSPSKRLSEWRRLIRGEAGIVVGARSAVFAPLRDLGLVIIDEEHESSYKSGDSPRYHARQVAMKRRALTGARLVMGSATPSVEAWRLMAEGGIERLSLEGRLSGGAPPVVEIVDMRGEEGPISGRLAQEIREAKAAGRQSILFLNRRGFSHAWSCRSCGHELRCRHCSVSLTYHKEEDALVCHYCGYRAPPPRACPECGSLDSGYGGFGTERVEEEVARLFPGISARRADADAIKRKGGLEELLAEFRAGAFDILLGTQMVAKGLNFPGVRLVGVISADTALSMPDFRAAERAFALIVQVSGRAGRYHEDGRVIVQTFRPRSPVVTMAAACDMEGFYAYELGNREALGFPPFARLIRIVFRGKDEDRVTEASRDFAAIARDCLPPEAELLGPADCPIGLMAGNRRRQVLLRSRDPGRLHAACARALSLFPAPYSVYMEPDPDPVNLL